MKSDDTRQDAATLGREFDAPPSVHETVFARIAERCPDAYRTGATRIEYAQSQQVLRLLPAKGSASKKCGRRSCHYADRVPIDQIRVRTNE